MVRAGKEPGLEVTLVDVLPWNNGHPAADGDRRAERAIDRDRPLDEDVARAVPRDARGPRRARDDGAELTDDGDHPSVEGYRRLGALLAQRLAR